MKITQRLFAPVMIMASLSGASAFSQDGQIAGVSGNKTIEVDAVYKIVSRHSGKCLDLKDHLLEDGATFQQWDCHDGANQKFKIVAAYKFGYRLENVESGLRLQIRDASVDNGGILEQHSAGAGSPGYFRFYATPNPGAFTIVNQNSGRCVDIEGPSRWNGAKSHQWQCYRGHASQEWVFVKQ